MPTLTRDFNSFEILKYLFSNITRAGRLRVIDASGKSHIFGSGSSPAVCIRFHHPSAYFKLLMNPSLSLGEIYMDGELTVEEGNLATFLHLLVENLTAYDSTASAWVRAFDNLDFFMRRFQQFNTPSKARSNVSHHYDLPPDFYEVFLDPERQYSCAYFANDSDTLETAQKNKMNHLLTKLRIEPDQQVLDIGCGWGGLACYIAEKAGARVTGITLSKEQLEYARKRASEKGLSNRVQFLLRDYRSMKGSYDRVVSVGMFEHVGINHYREFFMKIKKLIGKQGIAILHSIGRFSGPSSTNPWIRKYIFPGGYIPALSEVVPHVEKSGLLLTDLEILRLHYAKTLHHWSLRFAEQRENIKKIHGERFCRMWEFYLASSEVSFKHFGNMVFQMQLSGGLETVPLTRDYLYQMSQASCATN